MSNELDMKKQSTSVGCGTEVSGHVPNRRRLLRAGVKVVPVVLGTLSARTSLACHCTIPSAWGSIATGLGGPQDMSQVSLKGSLVRFGSSDTTNTSDNVRVFNNSKRNIPQWQYPDAFTAVTANGEKWGRWLALAKMVSLPNECDTDIKKVNYVRGLWKPAYYGSSYLKATGLLNKLGITGVTSSNFSTLSAQAVINNSDGDSSILVALFCLKFDGNFQSCLSQSDLVNMANGLFPKPHGFTSFGGPQIREYLHYNWIARWDYS